MKASIDNLAPTRSLIDVSAHSNGDSPLVDGYVLKKLYSDIILVKPVDESEDGDSIIKKGILIPKNAAMNAWRVGQVILKGPDAANVDIGDFVIFPNDRGLTVKNLNVAGVGVVKSGSFLNEERLFGTCEPGETDEDSSSDS